MQSLSRAAVLLSASALTLGLTATASVADSGTPTPVRPTASVATNMSGGEFSSAADKAEDRKIARLRKALDRARAKRADAYGAVAAAKPILHDADLIAHDSAVAVLAATEREHKAKADLTEARTRLNHVRALVKDTTNRLTDNHDAQATAAATLIAAEDTRDAAVTTAADLTTNTIPQATANSASADAAVETLRPQVIAALDLYTERTLAYHECRPQPNGDVDCLDFTYNWAIRSEVTHPWGIYLDLLAQQTTAEATAADMAALLADAQADLDAAEAAQVTATDTIATQTDLLATLTGEAVTLTTTLATAQADETPAIAAATKHEATLIAASTALNDAATVHKAHLDTEARAQQVLNDAYRTLAKAQDTARRVKDRLHRARQHKAHQHDR